MLPQFIKIINKYLISLPYIHDLCITTQRLKWGVYHMYYYRINSHTFRIKYYMPEHVWRVSFITFKIDGKCRIGNVNGLTDNFYIW